jgi:branched-chain amino acid transport system substrate-binding protein
MNADPSYPVDFPSGLTSSGGRPEGSPMAVTKRSSVRILPSFLSIALAFMSPAWALEPVNIGVCLPITGNLAASGQSIWEGIKIANQMEPQALERPVKLKLVDTKSNPAGAANAVFELIERDRVVSIIGEMVSSNTIAGAFHAERRKIPMVTPRAMSPSVTRGRQYVFGTSPIGEEQARAAATLAQRRLNAKTAAVICDMSQEHSIELADCFKNEFTQAGGRIVAQIRVKSGDRDFTAQINRIRSAKPDVMYASIYHMECALIARQALQSGMDIPMIAGDAVQASELLELGGAAVEGLLFTSYFHEGTDYTERGKKFRDVYEKERSTKPEAVQIMWAEAYLVILDAMRRAGSSDPARIREALDCPGSSEGVISKSSIKTGGTSRRAVCINEVRNGKFICVSGPSAWSLNRNSETTSHVIPTSIDLQN